MTEPSPQGEQRSVWRAIQAVAWGLLGVRKGSEFERDFARVNPLHVIVVGLIAVFSLVVGLIVLVNWIT